MGKNNAVFGCVCGGGEGIRQKELCAYKNRRKLFIYLFFNTKNERFARRDINVENKKKNYIHVPDL